MKENGFQIFILFLLITSCTQKECIDYYTLDRIQVINYNLQDSSNIIISGINPANISFTIPDTFTIIKIEKIDNPAYMFNVYLNKPIVTDYNYTVYFVDLDTSCYITDIAVKKEKCKDGIFGRSYAHQFDGYYVDGTSFSCQILKAFP